MTHFLLVVANVLLFAVHAGLVVFNVLGWIPRKLRRWNLATLLLTLASWTLMGIWYGRGYCVLTDWHWKVRAALGIHETADNYLVLLVRTLTGWDPPASLVSSVAFWAFLFSLTASTVLNVRDARIHRRLSSAEDGTAASVQA
ncbi:MAG: DUF2784 family protein [Armatimonadetes bacterium]|nr:DUF2784 family protein [Armatimonadota bacterium]